MLAATFDKTSGDATDPNEVFPTFKETSAGVAGALQLVDTTGTTKIVFDKTGQ